MALLCVAAELQAELNFVLLACHVHHGLSPFADDWQVFCQRLCDRLDVELRTIRVEVPKNSAMGLEAAARKQRYAAFHDLPVDALLLGQHRGDQAETLLFNLLRGASVHGARGMQMMRRLPPDKLVLRPWLHMPRAALEAYLRQRQQTWIEDESNQEARYSRNFLRLHVLPLLRSRFPAVEDKLAQAATHFAESAQLLDELALQDLNGQAATFPLPIECLSCLSEPRARNLLRYLLVTHGVAVPSAERLREALRQLLTAAPDRHPRIAFGATVLWRHKAAVHLEKCAQ